MKKLRRATAPLVLVVVAVLAALAVLVICRHVVDLEAKHDVALLAATSAVEVTTEIQQQIDEAERVASLTTPASETDRELALTSSATRVLARDSGGPVLDDAAGGLIVIPRYDETPPPTSTELRREALLGYVVAPLSLDDALVDLVPAGLQITVDGPRHRVASTPETTGIATVSRSASFSAGNGSVWSVTARGPEGQPPPVAWVAALLLLLSGGAAAAGVASRQRATRLRQSELVALQETNATVARLAVMAQQTRDLGDLLPSMTTELASALGLRGLAITTATPSGNRPLFGWGAPPDGDISAVVRDEVTAGESVWLRLSRGGRTAARLWVVAGRDLDRHEVNTLIGVADLVASALSNAEAFAQQQTLVERMRAVDELKSVFLATASHELRTPVVAIAGYASFLNENWDDLPSDKAHGLAERVDRNAQRLGQMVEDLLDFSRLERNNPLTEEQVALDLGEVVGQVLQGQSDLVQDHAVSSDLAGGLLVLGTKQALERVVTNLVGNATKYTPSGTRIRVLVRERAGVAELVVEDDGPGVPEADRERIFSRFYRGHGDEVTRTRGTGLGLAIVTEFAASMGGTIGFEESDSGGARFVVAFPLEYQAPRATLAPPASEHASGAPRSGDLS